MEFVSALSMLLLALVGYSAGSVLARRDQKALPELSDLLVMVAVWFAALAFRETLGRWLSVATWPLIGGVLGALIMSMRSRGRRAGPPEEPVSDNGRRGRVRGWLQRWKRFAADLGNYQGRILMAFFYFLAVTPFGLLTRLFLVPLRAPASQSFWVERSIPDADIERATKQF